MFRVWHVWTMNIHRREQIRIIKSHQHVSAIFQIFVLYFWKHRYLCKLAIKIESVSTRMCQTSVRREHLTCLLSHSFFPTSDLVFKFYFFTGVCMDPWQNRSSVSLACRKKRLYGAIFNPRFRGSGHITCGTIKVPPHSKFASSE